jgi:protein tyrosine/serine phosphatase
MNWLKKKLFNWAAESVGEIEDAIHHPLYGIHDYTADVYYGYLTRGSWPSSKKLAELRAAGIKTIVNLCSERNQDKDVKKAKLQAINIPFEDNTVPSAEQVTTFINMPDLASPVYVHCEEGKGRTGCMVAAFRVLIQGWTPEAALKEAMDFGLRVPAQIDFVRSLGKKPARTTGSLGPGAPTRAYRGKDPGPS